MYTTRRLPRLKKFSKKELAEKSAERVRNGEDEESFVRECFESCKLNYDKYLRSLSNESEKSDSAASRSV